MCKRTGNAFNAQDMACASPPRASRACVLMGGLLQMQRRVYFVTKQPILFLIPILQIWILEARTISWRTIPWYCYRLLRVWGMGLRHQPRPTAWRALGAIPRSSNAASTTRFISCGREKVQDSLPIIEQEGWVVRCSHPFSRRGCVWISMSAAAGAVILWMTGSAG